MNASTLSVTDRERIATLISAYGESGSSPLRSQWEALMSLPADSPVTLLNFFKLRTKARYAGTDSADSCSGQDAFSRYAAVSAPGLERVGGRFLLLAPFGSTFAGESEDWDFVAIGSYPNRDAVIALFEDDAYREAYAHRVAACERQKVHLCPA